MNGKQEKHNDQPMRISNDMMAMKICAASGYDYKTVLDLWVWPADGDDEHDAWDRYIASMNEQNK